MVLPIQFTERANFICVTRVVLAIVFILWFVIVYNAILLYHRPKQQTKNFFIWYFFQNIVLIIRCRTLSNFRKCTTNKQFTPFNPPAAIMISAHFCESLTHYSTHNRFTQSQSQLLYHLSQSFDDFKTFKINIKSMYLHDNYNHIYKTSELFLHRLTYFLINT